MSNNDKKSTESSSTEHLLTPKQAAAALGASESSLKRWCDQGALAAERTPGGHRRIRLNELLSFARETGRTLSDLAALGVSGRGGRLGAPELLAARVGEAVQRADTEALVSLTAEAFRAGTRLCEICDDWFVPALATVGQRWAEGEIAIFEERAASLATLACLARLEALLPPASEHAPLAICATPANDPYSIATAMSSLALREIGWRSLPLGAGLPTASLLDAVNARRPRLVALSVGVVEDHATFLGDYAQLRRATREHRAALVVGGRGLTPELRRQLHFDFLGETLGHLIDFARGRAC
jgi:excisionase family DNA binding protein